MSEVTKVRIGDLAERTGASVRSLRYYEQQDLLHSDRSPRGQRHYTEEAVERVRLIRCLLDAGLSTSTIAELLPCVDTPSGRTSEAALERMEQERNRMSAHIDELVQTRGVLDDLIAAHRQWHSDRAGASGLHSAACP